MTSEIETLKTNEFLRRRKLRLQQVREQSKDIAKKIRQRAKVEKIRHIVNRDGKKEKEYFDCQDKLVKRLEHLYTQGLQNVGVGHKDAVKLKGEELPEKQDVSKLRAKTAAAALRKKKQEKLDEQKKLLDRRLQARETANEISREKSSSSALVNKPKFTTSVKAAEDSDSNVIASSIITAKDKRTYEDDHTKDKLKVVKSDMGTQWDADVLPNVWESNVPALSLPKDDSVKESTNIDSKSDKSKRLNLFAVSDEMPSSLRGGLTDLHHEESTRVRPSLTLVSEYLQNRALHLRETDTGGLSKKVPDDIQSIKQTILKTRSAKPEGSVNHVCHVLDGQIIPMPYWQAEHYCEFCHSSTAHQSLPFNSSQLNSTSNTHINKVSSSIRPIHQYLLPNPMLRGSSPFRRNRISHKTYRGNSIDKSAKSHTTDIGLNKKSLVTMYNHATKDMRDVPSQSEGLVTRDLQEDEDAYSQAKRQTSIENISEKDKEHQQIIQDMRHKIAMTKQNVEKEYKDTMTFLNSLPKNTSNKPIKAAYMDERRQQMVKEKRQQKLEQEYKKIERENRKHNCIHGKYRSKTPEPRQRKAKSPMNGELSDNFETVDMEYSWMPVPDSDGSLAIHTIPTAVKTGKVANSVKFSSVDSYHEYRSRHKHTPPTKDTNGKQKRIETVLIQEQNQSSDNSSINSEASSIDNSRFENKERRNRSEKDLTDTDKIIIYKILNLNKEKKLHTKEKRKTSDGSEKNKSHKTSKQGDGDNNENIHELGTSLQHVKEGVYKTANENGDNVTSMYYTSRPKADRKHVLTEDEINVGRPCLCNKELGKDQQQSKGTYVETESNTSQTRSGNACVGCKCSCITTSQRKESHGPSVQPSASTSTSSFKTAANDKASNVVSDGGYINFIDEDGDETGKFYIGTSGLLKEVAYEFIIQLRKKDSNKKDGRRERKKSEDKTLSLKEGQMNSDIELQHPDSVVTKDTIGTEKEDSKLHEHLACRSPPDTGTKIIFSQKSSTEQPAVYDVNIVTTETENYGKSTSSKSSNVISSAKPSQTRDVSDKGVCTSFHDAYAIPIQITKSDFKQRVTTSTYTQTSLNSPNNRPIFMHMSSSTSTAYMSPPEIVLPKFLKQDDPVAFCNNKWFEVSEQLEYGEYADCTCKRCSHCRKVMLNAKQEIKKLKTPPNTARSCSSKHKYDNDKIPKCNKSSLNTCQILKQNSKCRKCESNVRTKMSVKPVSRKTKQSSSTNKRFTHPLCTNMNMSASQNKNKVNFNTDKNLHKSNLNPVLKKYVNKLLALNKESLKAIDVANQECSSITTPGSSIIEVPSNIHENKISVGNKISLEQIKEILKQKILEDCIKVQHTHTTHSEPISTESHTEKSKVFVPRIPRKKPVHKVKSLNISKRILKTKYIRNPQQSKENLNSRRRISTSTSTKEDSSDKNPMVYTQGRTKINSEASSTPFQECEKFAVYNSNNRNIKFHKSSTKSFKKVDSRQTEHKANIKEKHRAKGESQHYSTSVSLPSHRATVTSTSNYSDHQTATVPITEEKQLEESVCISTQTNRTADSDINFMKLAENKLQNMEKIADLTEKCTIRLSNLAKVLEEVRKNKSLAYSQISTSDSASESDHKSDKYVSNENEPTEIKITTAISDPSNETKDFDVKPIGANKIQSFYPNVAIQSTFETNSSNSTRTNAKENDNSSNSDYIPLLTGIPKPGIFESPVPVTTINTAEKSNIDADSNSVKSKGKPPTALSRINLKIGEENLIPHELSTVLEVDSPMSVKLKNQSSQQDNKSIISENEELKKAESLENVNQDKHANPDLLQNNCKSLFNQQIKTPSNDSPNDSKNQMMNLQQFNDIMLKPFPTIQEYAKQCNMGSLDEGSNLEDIPQSIINDELSSLHSDGSLPDVVAELLKRNIISEPFQFDSTSNGNSTTSESTSSALALSRINKEKKKVNVKFHHKDNIVESSDTLSVSSNPDLENAFKKLGMGWASSTLKKTKERLALSSSSNTSNSSMLQTFKTKGFHKQNIPALVTDSVSSIHEISKKKELSKGRKAMDSSKHAEQQTSMTNSMTVKEFLANELAKRITFTHKSITKDSEDEFVSLYSTKMPDELKHLVQNLQEERSMDSVPSGNNNRARTSTPVQIFRSITYQSSSSSNHSNDLFSNGDEISSVKITSNSIPNASSSDKDDLTIPNYSLKIRKPTSDSSKSD